MCQLTKRLALPHRLGGSDAVEIRRGQLVVDCTRVETREEAAKYQVEAPFYWQHYDFVLKPTSASWETQGRGMGQIRGREGP
jgi:hypothetical protein